MILFITLSSLIFTAGYNAQKRYDWCEEIEFKTKKCETFLELEEDDER